MVRSILCSSTHNHKERNLNKGLIPAHLVGATTVISMAVFKSCRATLLCRQIRMPSTGRFDVSPYPYFVKVKEHSCKGYEACYSIGFKHAETLCIEGCQGDNACRFLGDAASSVQIEGCNRPSACSNCALMLVF